MADGPGKYLCEINMRDKNVIDATGKAMDQWYVLLDESGAREMPHKEIAESLCGMGSNSGGPRLLPANMKNTSAEECWDR
jgi:hypothetical protein